MTHRLNGLYKKYFQKSKSFLFPILEIKKDSEYRPSQTYLSWDDRYDHSDCRLIVVYEKGEGIKWKSFLANSIVNNQFFDSYFVVDEFSVAVVFDLSCIKEDFMNVLNGKYSKLSKRLKTQIRKYFGYSSPEWAYMESYLFPSRYIKLYSDLLDVYEENIRVTGELCDLPDLTKETLKLKIQDGKNNVVDKFNMEYGKNI